MLPQGNITPIAITLGTQKSTAQSQLYGKGNCAQDTKIQHVTSSSPTVLQTAYRQQACRFTRWWPCHIRTMNNPQVQQHSTANYTYITILAWVWPNQIVRQCEMLITLSMIYTWSCLWLRHTTATCTGIHTNNPCM